jgi:hypothetical protein
MLEADRFVLEAGRGVTEGSRVVPGLVELL